MNKQQLLSLDLTKWLYYLSLPGMAIILLCGIFQVGEPAGFSAMVGITLLTATLVPAAFARLGWWKENEYLRYLLRHQKHLGITSGLWFVTHGFASALFFFDRSQPWLAQFSVQALHPTWLLMPAMIVILLTSINSVQRSLGNSWKQIHALIWLLLVPMMLHGNLAIAHFEKEEFAPASIFLFALIALAGYEAFRLRQVKRVGLIAASIVLIAIYFALAGTA
jgi:DMSO/TMAO reductase YedYZ heme-binding membrane subunit